MKNLLNLFTLLFLCIPALVSAQGNHKASLSAAMLSYETPGSKAMTGSGGILNISGKQDRVIYDLSATSGYVGGDRAFEQSEGHLTILLYSNVGLDLMSSNVKVANIDKSSNAVGLSYSLLASDVGIKLFGASDTADYGKYFTYGTKIDLEVSEASSLSLNYVTDDTKTPMTNMDVRFDYSLVSLIGYNLVATAGYKSTDVKNEAGTKNLKGNTTYLGMVLKF